jgi:multiple sugar transport system substrate-binding protein
MGIDSKKRRFSRRAAWTLGACGVVLLSLAAAAVTMLSGPRGPHDVSLGLFAGSAWDVPNPTVNRLYDGIIADFRAKNPSYSVSYRSGVRTQDYSERLAQDILNGDEPDLFFILPEDFTALASIGALADLGPFMGRGEVDPGLFYENALSAGRLGDVQYALPFEVVPSLMFTNLSLLRRLSLDEPNPSWRWEDFRVLAERATADTDGNGALDVFGVSGWSWLDGAYSNDELLFDPSGSSAFLDQDGVIDAVDFFLRLASLTSGTMVSDFESGRVLFAPFPYSSYRAYRYYPYSLQRFGDFEWRALPMPRGPKGKNATELRVLLVGMSKRSQRKEAAWEFLVHLTTDDEAAYRILAYSQGLPARKGILFTDRSRAILARHISGEEKPLDAEMLDRVISDSIVVPRFRRHAAALDLASRAIVAERPQSPSSLRNFLSRVDRAVETFLKE